MIPALFGFGACPFARATRRAICPILEIAVDSKNPYLPDVPRGIMDYEVVSCLRQRMGRKREGGTVGNLSALPCRSPLLPELPIFR